LDARGPEVKIAMSAERDQYPRHHGGHGGTAFVYLKSSDDAGRVVQVLQKIESVEEVLTRAEAAKKYRLNPHRIGDLWVTAVKDVVFGHARQEREPLARAYRSHGSLYERDIPCVIYRYAGQPLDAAAITSNVDVCRRLYQA